MKCPAARSSRRFSRYLAVTAVLVAGAASSSPVLAGPPSWAEGRILVAPRAGVSDLQLGEDLRGHGARSLGRVGRLNVHLVEVPARAEDAVVEALSHNPHFKFAEKDMLVAAVATANDPKFPSEWHLAKIQATTAWDSSQGNGVIVAVLDTGVDGAHPDLLPNLVAGWNVYGNNADTSDPHGHGTWVAGTVAAATNNGLGVASVAGSAKIMPVRIADANAYAYWSTVASGVTWAADHGARVANVSYNGVSGSSTVRSAAQYFRGKGGVVVVAAGNSGGLESIAENPDVLTVSATDSADNRASFSSYGDYVDLSAPGTSIVTTGRGGVYATVQGTSFSSPIVAGVAALMMAAKPVLTPSQIDALLLQSCDDLGTAGWDPYFGRGRVNATKAVQAALGAVVADTQAPTVSIAAPLGGVVKGAVPIDVTAWDLNGVSRVELWVNGKLVAADAAEPYGFSWDSATVADGAATLVAYAYDAAANKGASAAVSVTVDNVVNPPDITPPTVRITSPASGARVKGTVSIKVSSADNVGLSLLQVYADGAVLCVGNATAMSCSWNTRKVAPGAHTLSAKASDAAGNQTVTSIPVTVVNR